MGLSEMIASAQLAREMTPRGYWNPAPTTVTVIKLLCRGQSRIALNMMVNTTVLFVIALITSVVFIIYSFGSHFRSVRRRRRLVEGRSYMSEEEFLDSIALESKYDDVCLMIRGEMAMQAGVPEEAIYPSDTIEFISSLTLHFFDSSGIVCALEDGLNISHISDELAEKIPCPSGDTSLADAIRGFIECDVIISLLPLEDSIRTKTETQT